MNKKWFSLLISLVLFSVSILNCYAAGEGVTNPFATELFVRQEIFHQYALIYDTFNAAIVLDDGTEINGIGFTDYSAYYEAEDKSVGYFPAGFIADYGYDISSLNVEKGIVIENLDFSDERYQFVYDCETVPFTAHCVRDGNYLKYGVDDKGAITYEANLYERGVCDESLGALYSYDTGKYVFDPDMGNYIRLSGNSLYDFIDYAEIEAQVNQIIADQNNRLSEQEIVSAVHIAQESIVSYLLSLQQETFLGHNVDDLVEYASQLDPMECIRITPEGLEVINLSGDVPGGPTELAKWLVGIGCGIAVVVSTAVNIMLPVARPLCGAITGAAIDVFMQVVINNKSLENIQWEKVAVSAASGAAMAWLCPLAASGVTEIATKAGGKILGNIITKAGSKVIVEALSKSLGKLAGYGVLSLSNGLVSGMREYGNAVIDGKDGWPAFEDGVRLGVKYSIIASICAEAIPASGSMITKLLEKTKIGSKLVNALSKVNEAVGKADLWIRDKRIHLPKNLESIENILAPKSIHQAAESAWRELNNQSGLMGGKYSDMTNPGDGSQNKHEMPSHEAYDKANGITDGKRGELPAIKMSAEDHRLTASWGNSNAAKAFRLKEVQLISKGKMHQAIQMNIDNITSLFGTKYNEGIHQMLEYAKSMGWW